MVTTTRAAALLWPPDDTEESVVGTDRHQLTIMNVRLGINEVARASVEAGQPVPWQALSQTMLLGFVRHGGTRYTTLPDVFVYPHSVDQDRGSLSIALEGPPALVIEVASESTYDSDLDLQRGKGWTYAHAGVREYMVLDPTGHYLQERIRAWRLEGDAYQPWLPDDRGRWQSREIGIAIAVEDAWAVIYSRDGERQLGEGEISTTLRRSREALDTTREALDTTREELGVTREQLDATRAELARKDAELADLRRRLGDAAE
jgi:Uma2 family endonuclease